MLAGHDYTLIKMKNTLFIETIVPSQVKVSLKKGGQGFERIKEQEFGSQVLLNLILEVVEEAKISLPDLTSIEVASGPGAFTGLRVGVSVANALGFALGIPVNGNKMEVDLKY